MHVTLWVRGGTGTSGGSKVGNFVMTSTSTKGYNKWYICEMVKQIYKKDVEEGKFRFKARMIQYDHELGRD